MTFCLPDNKIHRIKDLLLKFLSLRKVTLRELQSLLGLLVFALRVIQMGWTFTKLLFRATCGVKSPFAHIRLTKSLKEDLRIWLQFIEKSNGHSLWQDDFVTSEALNLFTDSAGSYGYGEFFDGHWSAEAWPDVWAQLGLCENIVLLELFPVLVSLTIWGDHFQNKHILLHSDNEGVVFSINCLSTKSLPVITILRQIVVCCLSNNIWLKATYIPGIKNEIADNLSRFQWENFRSLAPGADPCRTPCPPHLWDLLLNSS